MQYGDFMKVLKKFKLNKKKLRKKLKLYGTITLSFINKYKYILFLALPFIAMDIITRIFGRNINFFNLFSFTPNLFTITWIILFLGLTLSLKRNMVKLYIYY